MRNNRERATTLLEVTVATAIITLVIGAVLSASVTAIRHFGANATQTALESAVAREMRIAVDVLKYSGTNIPPASIPTSIPLASTTQIPVVLAISTTPSSGGGVQIQITATSSDPPRSATLETTLATRAPAPGSTVAAPQTIGQPMGDP